MNSIFVLGLFLTALVIAVLKVALELSQIAKIMRDKEE